MPTTLKRITHTSTRNSSASDSAHLQTVLLKSFKIRTLSRPTNALIRSRLERRESASVGNHRERKKHHVASSISNSISTCSSLVTSITELSLNNNDSLLDITLWKERERKAYARCQTQSCSICLEFFNRDTKEVPQSILSCSHVFHQACLSSFQRYLGGNNTSTRPGVVKDSSIHFCPLCRFKGYQIRLTNVGHLKRRDQAAIIVQSLHRGGQARREFNKLIEQYVHFDDGHDGDGDSYNHHDDLSMQQESKLQPNHTSKLIKSNQFPRKLLSLTGTLTHPSAYIPS